MLKDKMETVQALVTIIAIVVGGAWTYNLFIKERQHFPHAYIEQKVSHLALSKDTNLLRVVVELTNTGSARLFSGKSITRVQQILPIPPCPKQGACASEEVNRSLKKPEREANRFSWQLLAAREQLEQSLDIEPGEKDFIEYEFAMPSAIQAVRIYSYLRNDRRSEDSDEIGWNISSYYDFRKPVKEGVK